MNKMQNALSAAAMEVGNELSGKAHLRAHYGQPEDAVKQDERLSFWAMIVMVIVFVVLFFAALKFDNWSKNNPNSPARIGEKNVLKVKPAQ